MELLTVLLLLLLGIVLLIIEFMLIPGITIAGIASVIAFGAGIVLSFQYWGTMPGLITLFVTLVFVPVFLYFLFKGRAVKPMMLNSDIRGKVINIDDQKIHIGDEGVSIGRLNPTGMAKIEGVSVEARSRGIFIDPKTPLKVTKIEGNTVIVEPLNQ
ncbi:MAG: NfeD family protein [Prolixibacteraceae bacterium]|nr:NfeD family protein [Prolixibacteraceae bacterium]